MSLVDLCVSNEKEPFSKIRKWVISLGTDHCVQRFINEHISIFIFCSLYYESSYTRTVFLLTSHTGSHCEEGSFCGSRLYRVLLFISNSHLSGPHDEVLKQMERYPIL